MVDDASPDDCAAIAEDFVRLDNRVRLIRLTENGGVSRAFNVGFDAARGEYMTRLAQDDFLGVEAIASMTSRLVERPEAGLVYGDYVTIDEFGAVIRETSVPEPVNALLPRNSMGLCVMWRRAVWDTVGGFDSRYDTAEDYEYWLRSSAHFSIVRCAGRGLFFARYHHNMGSLRFYAKQEEATLSALRSSLRGGTVQLAIALRRAMSHVLYSSAYDYSVADRHAEALSRIARSFVLWPCPFHRREVRTALARPKLFARCLIRYLTSTRLYRVIFEGGER